MIDPPFEEGNDFAQLAGGLSAAQRKWATGIYALWYPIKGRPEPDALAKSLSRLGIRKIMRAEVTVAPLSDPSRLNGSGLIVVNPPWTLEAELSTLLPVLAGVLGATAKAPIAWIGSLASRGPFPRQSSWCVVLSLAVTFRLRFVGAGGVTEAG